MIPTERTQCYVVVGAAFGEQPYDVAASGIKGSCSELDDLAIRSHTDYGLLANFSVSQAENEFIAISAHCERWPKPIK